jgi:hypothetical protein
MPMMGQGMGNLMMNPKIIQMRMQHMANRNSIEQVNGDPA